MHYYQFNIADYRKDTIHLTPIEHYIYRTLIDWYYLDEKPIPKITQVVSRRLGVGFDMEPNIANVLKDFFIEHEDGWHHKRIDVEITEYHGQCDKNKTNGKLGGRPKKTQVVSSGNPELTQTNPTITLTTNHKPLTINQEQDDAAVPKEELGESKVKNSVDFEMLEAGSAAVEMRRLGVNVQSINPTLLAWIADGFSIARMTEAVEIARLTKPAPERLPANYIDRILREEPKKQSLPVAKIPRLDNFAAKNYGSEITAL